MDHPVKPFITPMSALILAEWQKHARSKLPYIGFLATIIFAIFWSYGMRYYTADPTALSGYQYAARTMQVMTGLLTPVFAAIFGANLLASEASQRTLHGVLCRPVSRMRFLFAKFLTTFAFVILMVLIGAVTTVIAVGNQYQYNPVMLLGKLEVIDGPQFWLLFVLAGFWVLIPLFATAAFGLFMSIIFTKPGTAVGVAVGLLVTMEPFKVRIRMGDTAIAPFVWTNWFEHPWSLVDKFGTNIPALWNTYETWDSLLIPSLWLVGFFVATAVIMYKKDWA